MPSSTYTITPSTPAPAVLVLRRHGLHAAPNHALAEAEQLSPAEFAARYPTRDDLLHHLIEVDLERQKHDHRELYARFSSPVDRLFGLVSYAMADLADVTPQLLAELSQHAVVRELLQEYVTDYSLPQLHQLLNEGVRQRLFRSDLNIQLVSIVINQLLNVVLTPQVFPPTAAPAEVFRSVFLYYIRGLCTDAGAQQAAEHFARL